MKNRSALQVMALITTISALALPNLLHAQTEARGIGAHGGETVDIDGRPVLRDLVDKTVCIWKTGTSVIESVPHFKLIVSEIETHHWYFSQALLREMKFLKVCFSQSELTKIPSEDHDSVTISTTLDSKQVAIRLNDMIYIDQKIFNSMDDENKGYLLIHETIHSFIPFNVSQRNQKVRSMVASIKALLDRELNEDDFSLQLRMNQVHNLQSSRFYDPIRENLMIILNPGAGIFSKTQAAGEIYMHHYPVYSKLLKMDSSLIDDLLPEYIEDKKFELSSPTEKLEISILEDSVKKLNQAFVAGAHPYDLVDNHRETALVYSASKGKNKVLQAMLEHNGVDVNFQKHPRERLVFSDYSYEYHYSHSTTPLIAAVNSGQKSTVELLLAHPDIDPNRIAISGGSAIHAAVQTGSLDLLKLIVSHPKTLINLPVQDVLPGNIEADKFTGYWWRTQIYTAVDLCDWIENRTQIREFLISKGGKNYFESNKLPSKEYHPDPNSAEGVLFESILTNSMETAQKAFIRGMHPHDTIHFYSSTENPAYILSSADTLRSIPALHLVARRGALNVLLPMLEIKGFDPNLIYAPWSEPGFKWRVEYTPLYEAAISGHAAVVHALIRAKADVNKNFWMGGSAILAAIASGNVSSVKLILQTGKINVKKRLKGFMVDPRIKLPTQHVLDVGAIDGMTTVGDDLPCNKILGSEESISLYRWATILGQYEIRKILVQHGASAED